MPTNASHLAEHILAMEDDAHFQEHPEWDELVKEARSMTNSHAALVEACQAAYVAIREAADYVPNDCDADATLAQAMRTLTAALRLAGEEQP